MTHYGVGGETYAWLGQLAPAKEVDVSTLPPTPPGVFNDRIRERKCKPVKKGRTCSRPDCGRSLDLGRHKTRCPTHDSMTCGCPLVCRKCRDAETQAARETQAEHEEFGTPEEIAAQLSETRPVEELDDELADEDEK